MDSMRLVNERERERQKRGIDEPFSWMEADAGETRSGGGADGRQP